MTNPYFNLYNATNEQTVVEGLIIESIQRYGMDIVYAPKTFVDRNLLIGEDPQKAFLGHFIIEMYIETADGFGGNRFFQNEMGYNMDKQITFVVSRKRFHDEVNINLNSYLRPNEGDILLFPISGEVFEVLFVESEAPFYQLGKNFTWKLVCEKFNYSHEKLETGISEIDQIAAQFENNDSIVNDPLADNTIITTQITDFLDPDSINGLTE